MTLLCLGGSFNPIHHGHLIAARAAAEIMGIPRVMFIPCQQSPHKLKGTALASAEDRLALCQLAVADSPSFHVSRIELDRSGPSYTVDTLRLLKLQGWSKVRWLIGADQLPLLPSWREFAALMEDNTFVVMVRPGWTIDWDALPESVRPLHNAIVTTPLLDISSTDIRARIGAGKPIDYLTPPPVCRYIAEHGLYRGK